MTAAEQRLQAVQRPLGVGQEVGPGLRGGQEQPGRDGQRGPGRQHRRPARHQPLAHGQGDQADERQGRHQHVAGHVMSDHRGEDGQPAQHEPARPLAVDLPRGQAPGGQQGEREEGQGQRLVDEHRVERGEQRVAGVIEHGHAAHPVRAADLAEQEIQDAHEEQVGDSRDDQPGDEDRQPGHRAQGRGHFLQARVARADRQEVIDREQPAGLQQVQRAAPVLELIREGEGGRAVAHLDQVLGHRDQDNQDNRVAPGQRPPPEQPHRRGHDDQGLPGPVRAVRPSRAGVTRAARGVRDRHDENPDRGAERDGTHRDDRGLRPRMTGACGWDRLRPGRALPGRPHRRSAHGGRPAETAARDWARRLPR